MERLTPERKAYEAIFGEGDESSTATFTIVCGLDFSQHGYEALRAAVDMAKANGRAEVHLVHVVHPPVGVVGVLGVPAADSTPQLVSLFDHARTELEGICNHLSPRARCRVVGHVRTGEAGHEITTLARELQADLIVVGTHGRTGLGRVLLGSIATNVTKHAPCSVLVVRRPLPQLSAHEGPDLAPEHMFR